MNTFLKLSDEALIGIYGGATNTGGLVQNNQQARKNAGQSPTEFAQISSGKKSWGQIVKPVAPQS